MRRECADMYEEAKDYMRINFILTYLLANKRGRAVDILKNGKKETKTKIYQERKSYPRKRIF